MDNQKGMIINQACQIILRTYKEIDRLKNDFAELLSDYEPSMKYEEYSYGTNSLYLKPNHTYLFKRTQDESETASIKEEHIWGMICIFYDERNFNRINLKDQPELWVGLLDLKNRKQTCIPWEFYNLLTLNERKNFTNGELRIGGDIFEYRKVGNTEEEWNGRFIGYSLVDITNREVLKTKIVDKLIKVNEKTNQD